MSTNWATSPGSVIDSNSYMGNDSKILRERKFEQQRMLQQQRQQQKRQVCDMWACLVIASVERYLFSSFLWILQPNYNVFYVPGYWYGDTKHASN